MVDAALADLVSALSSLVSHLTDAERDGLDRALMALVRAGKESGAATTTSGP